MPFGKRIPILNDFKPTVISDRWSQPQIDDTNLDLLGRCSHYQPLARFHITTIQEKAPFHSGKMRTPDSRAAPLSAIATSLYSKRVRIRFRSAAIGAATLLTVAACVGNRLPSAEALEQRIQSILELPTYEQVYRDIVYVKRERTILGIRTARAEVLFSIDIRVQAGIDLGEGVTVTRDPDGRGVIVGLPNAKIFVVDADESTINEYFVNDRRETIDRLDYYDEIDAMKETIRSDAINREILAKAELNAQNLIVGLLTAAGFEEVRFARR